MISSTAKAPIGILLTNVGTPSAPAPNAVRTYLGEFLSDQRIVDYPRWLWLPLLHAIILRVRPRRSARLYNSIWTHEGSPLQITMGRIAVKLEKSLNTQSCQTVHIEIGMRYGQPSIAGALKSLQEKQVCRIIIFPLYPQYSGTTTGTSFDAVFESFRDWPYIPDVDLISGYHDHPAYLQALERHVRSFWERKGQPEHLLLSFHGIPERYASSGDPYPQQCKRSAELLTSKLDLLDDMWSYSYQSRFGPEPWLRPYTDEKLEHLAHAGVKSLHVIAPGFSVDCLETLGEIQVEGQALFKEAGERSFHYIPALNDTNAHIDALATIIQESLLAK